MCFFHTSCALQTLLTEGKNISIQNITRPFLNFDCVFLTSPSTAVLTQIQHIQLLSILSLFSKSLLIYHFLRYFASNSSKFNPNIRPFVSHFNIISINSQCKPFFNAMHPISCIHRYSNKQFIFEFSKSLRCFPCFILEILPTISLSITTHHHHIFLSLSSSNISHFNCTM